jgi:ADP-ribose pyrophosphatase YjhB (NUDIX family)
MRPGWGVRHPAFADILRSLTPLAAVTTRWAAGTLPLRITAYMPLVELPHELVVSVRCLVTVDDALLMCVNADGTHPWPGGRREPGETFSDTASREVHEETGWILDPDSLRPLGWLHLEHLARPPEDYQYPHPDFLQVVFAGHARNRDHGGDGDWTDIDGYEVRSCLVPRQNAVSRLAGDRMSQLARPFLARL